MARGRKQLKDYCWERERERENAEQKHTHVLLTEVLKWLSFCVLPLIIIWNGGVGSCLTEIVAEVSCVFYCIILDPQKCTLSSF